MDAASRQQDDAPADPKALSDFLSRHCSLPSGVRNTAPKRIGSVGQVLFNKLLPALRLRWVKVTPGAGLDALHRFNVGVPGYSCTFTLTSLSCLMVGRMLHEIYSGGALDHAKEVRFELGVGMGTVAIPVWAVSDVLKNITTILESNRVYVEFLYDEVLRLKGEHDDTEPRTIH